MRRDFALTWTEDGLTRTATIIVDDSWEGYAIVEFDSGGGVLLPAGMLKAFLDKNLEENIDDRSNR